MKIKIYCFFLLAHNLILLIYNIIYNIQKRQRIIPALSFNIVEICKFTGKRVYYSTQPFCSITFAYWLVSDVAMTQ